MQTTVSKTINQRTANTLNHTAQPEHDYTASGMAIPTVEITEDFFMPKKSIQRSDGATLSDIYNSKREDSWGKILKAQLAEEVGGYGILRFRRVSVALDIHGVIICFPADVPQFVESVQRDSLNVRLKPARLMPHASIRPLLHAVSLDCYYSIHHISPHFP